MESNYHKTFTIDQETEIKEFFSENGYVAIRDIYSEQECKDTLDDINKQMKQLNPDFDINNISTYEHAPIINNYGLFTKKPIFTEQFLKNRENEKLFKAFCILYGNDKIIVNHDRCALYRPTKGLTINADYIDKPEWKTNYTFPNLHLDFHPSSYFRQENLLTKREMLDYKTTDDFVAENNLYCKTDGLEIQGVINFIDNREEDGGYQCIPKFIHEYEKWCAEKKYFEDTYTEGVYHFSKTDKIDMKYVYDPIRIPVPKGSVILWSQLLAHGTKPNNSDVARMIQFIKAYPKKIFSKERLKRRSSALKKIFNEIKFTPSRIGRIVFNQN